MDRHAIAALIVTVVALLTPASCIDGGGVGVRPTFTEFAGLGLTGMETCSIAWGDCDNDGDLDLAIAGYAAGGRVMTIYENDGAGGFTEFPGLSLRGVSNCSLAWGDCDNDGDLDLAVGGWADSGPFTTVYENDGAGGFTEFPGLSIIGVFRCSLAWGDCDNDGDLDLAIAGYESVGRVTTVYENDGAGGFTEFTGLSLTGVSDCSLAWGDCDNDGDLDLAVAGDTGSVFQTTVYEGDGAGGFDEFPGLSLTGVERCSLVWGDCDSDGDLDLAVAGDTGAGFLSTVYENDGAGGFAVFPGLSLTGVIDCSLAWGDCDNDGDLDLAVAGDTGSVYLTTVYESDGAGGFAELPGLSLTGVAFCSLAWGDVEGDGDLDLAVAGWTGGPYVSTIYENDGPLLNFPPNAPTGLEHIGNVFGYEILRCNRSTDAETPFRGLSYNLMIREASGLAHVYPAMADETTGARRLSAFGPVVSREAKVLFAIKLAGGDYEARVQAIDSGFEGGPWSEPRVFTVP